MDRNDRITGVQNLRLKFPGQSSLLFKDLTLSFQRGERVLLLGPSGCGKSTLLQVLSGLMPNAVEVPMKADEVIIPHSWGFVFQDPDAQFCMPFVDEELAFVLENIQVPREEMPGRIRGVLDLVRLELEELHTSIQHLSQGMKQRLALASVLSLEPEVLLLDEPTALLDPEGTKQVWDTLKRVTEDQTVLIVEHKVDEIIDYVQRVILFNDQGQIIADGPTGQVFHEHKKELEAFGIWYTSAWNDFIAKRQRNDQEAVAAHEPIIHHKHTSNEHTSNEHTSNEHTSSEHTSSEPTSNEHTSNEHTSSEHTSREPTSDEHIRHKHIRDCKQVQVELKDFAGFRGKDVKIRVNETEVGAGEWICIVGQNGAGKSTFLYALMLLIKTDGEYKMNGTPASDIQNLAAHYSFVFQNPEFQFVTNTVYDEIAYSLKQEDKGENEIDSVVLHLLQFFGLEEKREQHPYQLSMGQKRRLSVASALVQNQKILLLDEPTFGQDARNTFILLEQLEQLRIQGKTIIMVTHDLHIVDHFATRVWEVKEGELNRDVHFTQELDPQTPAAAHSLEEETVCKSS